MGRLGGVAVVLVAAAALVGFTAPRETAWIVVQVVLAVAATAVYLLALVRSPD